MEPTRTESVGTGTASPTGVVRACRVEDSSVRTLLRASDRPRFAWADGTAAVGAGGATATLRAGGPGRFEAIREQAAALFDRLDGGADLPEAARPRLIGGFPFTATPRPDAGDTWAGYERSTFVLPAVQLTVTPDVSWLTATAVGPEAAQSAQRRLETWRHRLAALPALAPTSSPGIESLSYTPDRDTWREQVGRAVERIEGGRLQKVVLAQSLTARLAGSATPLDVLARLDEQYPDCYRFLFDPGEGGCFFGASPERLVTVRGPDVETDALAGSTRRGETAAEDDRLAAALRESAKDNHEHDLVVEAIRDQLRAMDADSRTGERTVRRLATLQHLETPIRATLSTPDHVLSLVEALHPTPAVGGLPPAAALQTIRETETFDRGWYAAPVGWFDAEGDGDFAVAIRSGVARGNSATLFAGAGVVQDSDPAEEWKELELKYRPILDQLA